MQAAPPSGAALTTWLDFLLAIHPTEIDMGLARVQAVAKRMELDHLGDTKVVTVAGTNGKGTTCAMIEAALRLSGKSVGVYSSPHLLKYNERVRINGVDATDVALVAAFEAIELARAEISLTFFEYATLAGLYLFKAAKLDVVLLEVGLGGRLDAINLIDADIAVVTSIDLDHQEYLGDTRELVGAEKAGIFRANRPAIVGEEDCPESLIQVAENIGALLYRVGSEFNYQCTAQDWHYQGQQFNLNKLPLPFLPQPNAATVIAVLEHLCPTISADIIAKAVGETQLAGRLEHLSQSPKVIVDVAHNPHAARYLKSRLAAMPKARLFALCGMLKDKDARSVLQELATDVNEWFLCDLSGPRGASAIELNALMPHGVSSQTFAQMQDAWHAIKAQLQADDVVIVFGSFYTVAGFKDLFKGEELV
ncbi:bifunctional tetrahydrofolate synthase/dihydrofolate synthase [Shewanella sp. 1CM18E]|uniref:bifunctional tetrahydrofolate synthase/dihydrofolate synthase n=1 Tax=Shewanella sp. 1CM18E TaxID=2929169 RepID=UPI0020BEC112|nr:bifunctional tetrahydrofolate synthase/dihydrofolate synthase [Shewanella sp. 1CM18E]MCK8044026.1 bifunctional tetrahydrofolate synthase/dihydrofolate synthase [Shewanella sp. 1CM18E]